MQQSVSLKKVFLYGLIGSVSISALMGIVVVMIGDFGELEVRILLTSLTVSGASLCGLSCGAALESGRQPRLPSIGIGLALTGAALLIFGIWTTSDSKTFWKITATVCFFGAASTHMVLLLMARLAPRFTWSQRVAYGAVFGVAGILTYMIWTEFDTEVMSRVLGVVAILDGAVSILIPIFHRLSRGETDETGVDLAQIDAEIRDLRERLQQLEQQRATLVDPQDQPKSQDQREARDGR